MWDSLSIETSDQSLTLSDKGSARLTFTVTNNSNQRLPIRAQLSAKGEAEQSWFTVEGQAERQFAAGAEEDYTVKVQTPEGTVAGDYQFSFNVVGVNNPDEEFAPGPTVTVTLPEPEKKPFPWWIVILVAGVLLIGGAAFFLFGRGGGDTVTDAEATNIASLEGTPTIEPPTAIPDDILAGTATGGAQTSEAQFAVIAQQTEAAGATATAIVAAEVTAVAEEVAISAATADAIALTAAASGDDDGDGISNSQEASYGTDPANADSDGDGLADGEEVFIYRTDPAVADSDGDGATDGDEVIANTDPLVAPTATPTATPLVAPALPVTAQNITILEVNLLGQGGLAVVPQSALVDARIRFTITDPICPGCIDQIIIGLADDVTINQPHGCIYSGVPGNSTVSGNGTANIQAPAVPGTYYVRFRQAQAFNCNLGWWTVNFTPGPNVNIGIIIVQE